MKKRMLSLILALCLALSLSAPAFAADARDTNFFTRREHGDVDLADMLLAPVDLEEALAQMDEVRALSQDPANLEKVKNAFRQSAELFALANTQESLAYYYMASDVYDEAFSDYYEQARMIEIRILDALCTLTRDILLSPCAAALDDFVPLQDRSYYLNYEPMTEADFSLDEESAAQSSDYLSASGDWEEIFMRMVKTRNSLAKSYGYENYYDFAFTNVYQRDYTPNELDSFRSAVIEKIVPLIPKIEMLLEKNWSDIFEEDYTGDTALDMIEPCLADMSDELLESFRYLRKHGLIDNTYSYEKAEGAFTAALPIYNVAYIMAQPYIDLYDFTTVVHEFGHFNNYYWTPVEWDGTEKSVDIAEVHSQALELLFLHYYPELFGEDAFGAQLYIIDQRLFTIVNVLLVDSLEQYIYRTPNVTIQGINREYARLLKEYGLVEKDYPIEEYDGWSDISHLFTSPCYYVSYAVSVAGAWDFWIESQTDFYGAADKYLRFAALGNYESFKDSFSKVGMQQPLTADMVSRLADALKAFLAEDEEQTDAAIVHGFKDVKVTDWFAPYVDFICEFEIMSGTSKTTFDPNGALTRAQIVTILWRMDGEEDAEPCTFSDVPEGKWFSDAVAWAQENDIVAGYKDGTFHPNDPITREQLASILYRYMQSYGYGYTGAWAFPMEFDDADAISGWAKEAMSWMVMHEIMSGTGNGKISPKSTATRAQAAVMLVNLIDVIAAIDYYQGIIEAYENGELVFDGKDFDEMTEEELLAAILAEHGLLALGRAA